MVETTLLVDWVGQCVKGIIGRRGAAQGVFHHLAQLKGQQLGHVLIQWSRPCTGRDARSTFGAALSIEHGMASQASADILACQNWSDPTRPLDSGSVHSLTRSLGRDPRVESAHSVGHGPAYLRGRGPVHLRGQLPYNGRGDFRTTSPSVGRSLSHTGPGNHLGSGQTGPRKLFGHPFLVAEVASLALILLSGKRK